MLPPARRRIRLPPAKVHGGLPIVVNRDTQDKQRHNPRLHKRPGSVVPGAGIPVIVLIDPVHAIVEEVIGIDLRRIVHRIAWHSFKVRVHGHVYPDAQVGQPDADAHIGSGKSHRACQHAYHNEYITKFSHFSSIGEIQNFAAYQCPRPPCP